MKFKVGDKVRVRKDLETNKKYGSMTYVEGMGKMKGKTVTIKEVCLNSYWIEEFDYNWTDEMFEEKVDFTKSDLKDGDIVTQRDGYQKVVCAGEKELRGINECTYLQMENYTTNLLDKDKDTNFDIIKVERPTGYKIVFERKEEILDEVEKRYLRDVIRPFSEDIENIRKITTGEKEYLMILFKDGDRMNFKNFKKGAMYKNMEADRSYALEELGL